MHLVNDIDLKSALRRRVRYLLHNLTDIVHAVIGCGIDLDHIHAGTRRNGLTARTFPAGTSLHGMLTVHRPRKDLGDRSLTCASRSTEEIGVPDTIRLYLILQCSNDMLLPFYLLKTVRPELTV